MSTTFTNVGHAERYLQKLWKKCQNEELCDAVLIAGVDEKRIPAHRSVLSEESEYLSEILTSDISKEVKIPNVNGLMLHKLIEYCYKGFIVISEDTAFELLKTAHMLRLKEVVIACENFLLKHFMEISKKEGFLQLNVEKLSQLLASDDLLVPDEAVVFNSVKAWLEHDPLNREQHKVELLKLVRLPFVEGSFLVKNVKPICTTVECLQIYMDALEFYVPSDGNMPSGANLMKPRQACQTWMGITMDHSKMFIHYYCPQLQKWMKCLKELEYRYYFGMALLKNCLYIFGGQDAKGNILNKAICLNLNTMTLTEISPMIEKRFNCTAAALNGFLYVLGGYNGTSFLNSVEKWNPKTNKWNKVASMSVNRRSAGAVVLNNKLYVVAGFADGKILSSAECYDPVKDMWQNIAPMGESRSSPGVAVANGLLYTVSGKSAERYDPQTNKWTSVCSLREPLYPDFSCTTLNDKIVVSSKNHFEEYDAVSDEWKMLETAKPLDNSYRVFSYSGKLPTSQFVEM